jgi:hypothetical protein
MATAGTPMPQDQQGQGAPPQGGAPDAGSQPQPPQQGGQDTATGLQQLLAKWYQAAKSMASADSRLASGANKVAQGCQEMQSALITPQQPTPQAQQPMTS